MRDRQDRRRIAGVGDVLRFADAETRAKCRRREVFAERLFGEKQGNRAGRGLDGECEGYNASRTVGFAGRHVSWVTGASGDEHSLVQIGGESCRERV